MVWVNAMWLISLVMSLTCALIATLLQQWARRYIETPKIADVLRYRSRVRSLLLDGTKLYKITLIVEMLPTLLHLSVYLFLGGLVIAFHTVHKTVAIAVDVAVGVSGLAYIVLSILPCLDLRCPYRTPISQILWYPCHAFFTLAALFLHSCLLGLHKLLNQRVLLRWLQSRRLSVSNHWRYFTNGLEKSVVYGAVEMQRDGDRKRVTWLFNELALGDKYKFLMFAASIPRRRIPDLIPSIKDDSFRESLLILLRSCLTNIYTAWPGTDVPERSLLVCLHAIRHIVKAKSPTIPDLDFMRAHLANTGLMRELWDDIDDSIRITSCSICALVAKQVVRKRRLKWADLNWLQEVFGKPSNSIFEAGVTVRDQMNFKSFVYGTLNHVMGTHRDLSPEDATSFNETLAILLDVRIDSRDYFATYDWQIRLSEEVGRIQMYDRQGGLDVFDRLRLVFPSLPTLRPVREASPSRAPPTPPTVRFPHAPPSPRPVPRRAATPPPSPPVYHPRPTHHSHGAYRHRAPM